MEKNPNYIVWSINLEISNLNSPQNFNYSNTVYQIQTIGHNYVQYPEILIFEHIGATRGFYQYSYDSFKVNKTFVQFNISEDKFYRILKKNFAVFSTYLIGVSLETYDYNSVLLSSSSPTSSIYKRKYIVKINRKIYSYMKTYYTFPINIKNHNASNQVNYTVPSIRFYLHKNSSGNIGDKFQIYYKNQAVQLQDFFEYHLFSPNFYGEAIEKAFFEGFGRFIKVYTSNSYDYPKYTILFEGEKGDVPQLIVNSSEKLPAGLRAEVKTIRQGSSNLRFQPIRSEFLRMPSDKPSVLVKVNGVLSQCQGDCSYTVDSSNNLPTITSASLNGNIIDFNLDNNDVQISYKITFADQFCVYLQNSYPYHKCLLPTYENGDLNLQAGLYFPKVLIPDKGYLKYAEGLVGINIPLIILELIPNFAQANGGALTKIKGKGFPKNNHKIYSLKQCNKNVNIVSVSNNQIEFYSAECSQSSTNLVLNFNSEQASSLFTYYTESSLKIYSINPTSRSPIHKGIITLTGLGFGTNKSLIQAWLTQNNTNIVFLNVFQINDTMLKLKMLGGYSGTFKVKVIRTDIGVASTSTQDANKFVSQIFIDKIYPNTGYKFGGLVISITGQNFSSDIFDSQVFIGNQVSLKCQVLTATSSKITCRIPILYQNYQALQHNITILTKNSLRSTCRGQCTFTYDNKTYSTINYNITPYFKPKQSVTYRGTNLTNKGVPPKVFIDSKQAAMLFADNSTVTFTFPDLYLGTYSFNVLVFEKGYVSIDTSVRVQYAITSKNINGSTEGNIILINGSGFLPQYDPNFFQKVLNVTNIKYQILEIDPSQIKVEIGKCGHGQNLNFAFTINMQNLYSTYTCSKIDTPIVILKSENQVLFNPKIQIIRFNQTSSTVIGSPQSVFAYLIDSENERFGIDIFLTIVSNNKSQFTVNGSILSAGKYKFRIFYTGKGYASCDNTLLITYLSPPMSSNVESGYRGGGEIKITGLGLNLQSKLIIGGKIDAQMDRTKSTTSQLYYKIPEYLCRKTNQSYNLLKEIKLSGQPIADFQNNASYLFDNRVSTTYTFSSQAQSFLGLDFGRVKRAAITQIKFLLDQSQVNNTYGCTISGSVDKSTWTQIGIINQQFVSGWNTWKQKQILYDSYRYVVIKSKNQTFTFAQLQLYGFFISQDLLSLDSNVLNVDLINGFYTHSNISQIHFKQNLTPIVQKFSKRYSSPIGGDSLVITGLYFGSDLSVVKVLIDEVQCVVEAVNNTEITCIVGKRDIMPPSNTFSVTVAKNIAVLLVNPFVYASRWSDELTWSTNFPPIDNDTVYVPQGMTLIVDQSTPKLHRIVVEGTIIFADEKPMIIQAEAISISKGKFIAGTESEPYQNQLTFILSGSFKSKQLPEFGNKVIACYHCTLDIHGKIRDIVWTELAETATAGSNQIKLTTAVDWKVGEHIVLASTSYNHAQSEQKIISQIDETKKIITLTDVLKYSHKSTNKMYGSYNISLRGEVGLLTRNIKIRGDDDSGKNKYGVHLMMFGISNKGLISRIQYVEFSNCGQQQTLRYCIHFRNNDDLSQSIVKGNSIHHSYARAITLKHSSNLRIESNVCYLITGHSIFLEKGTQRNNKIQNNLVISTLKSNIISESDIYPSSFYITNPLNTLKNNRAAGSDGNGISYYLKYPIYTIKTFQNPIFSSDNMAHSNSKSGLEIYCNFVFTNRIWPANNTFQNYYLWNNRQNGVNLFNLPNAIFNNFVIIDFGKTGISTSINETNCNYSTIINNSLIASSTTNNYKSFTGIYMKTTPNYLNHLTFCNFPNSSFLLSLPQLSFKSIVNYLSNISTLNITGSFFQRKDSSVSLPILDSSLSVQFDGLQRIGSTIINYADYNGVPENCSFPTNSQNWENLIMCNSTVETVTVIIQSSEFDTVNIRRIDEQQSNKTQVLNSYYQSSTYFYHLNFIGGNAYHIQSLSFQELNKSNISTGCFPPPKNQAIILRYNYSIVYDSISTNVEGQTRVNQRKLLNKSTCRYGDYYYTQRYFYLCISARGWKPESKIEIVYSRCNNNCILQDMFCQTSFPPLYWSNSLIWRKQRLPLAGQDVTIPYNCSIILDIDVENLNSLVVDGTLTVEDQDCILSAKFIWIKGQFSAGTNYIPFESNLIIKLLGQKSNLVGFQIDQNLTLSKSLLVTGKLQLYGKTPKTLHTKLTSIAHPGDMRINVESTDGWEIGQTLGISPSFNNYYEYQKFIITALTPTLVAFTPALNFTHYGNVSPLKNSYGEIDMRATVGLFDRNIRIMKEDGQEEEGYTVFIYGLKSSNTSNSANAVISNVWFKNGGQQVNEKAALSIINTNIGNVRTIVTNSVFENCFGSCMYFKNTKFLNISNNFLFQGQTFLVYAEQTQSYIFQNNILIGARNRSQTNEQINYTISCYYQNNDNLITNSSVKENICQGSQGSGFILPFVSCSDLHQNAGYIRNTVGSADIGFVIIHYNLNYSCMAAGYLRVYGCNIGVTSNPQTASVVWNNLMLADNKRSLGFIFGGSNQNNNNSLFLTNSWISVISRPQCEQCYGQTKTGCSNSTALRLLVVSKNNLLSFNDDIQLIIQAEEIDSNAWISNVTFQNFKLNYTSSFANTLSSKCSNNRLFQVHPSADSSIGNHHFFNTICKNCHIDSFGYFSSPRQFSSGQEEGCGGIQCTGRENYLIQDHDGTFLGFEGTIVPSNKIIGQLPNCIYNSETNGYFCNRTDIGRLKFQSISQDYQTRIIWPAKLINYDNNLTTTISAWKQTSKAGTQTFNRRQAKFLSLVQLSHSYNISFTSQPSSDMLFSLSLTELQGNNLKWICIIIHYPIINSISITLTNGSRRKSIISTNNQSVINYSHVCGAHKYYYKQSLIHFIVTADANCIIRVTLTSSVRVTIRLNVQVSALQENNELQKFTNLICTFLNISTNRLDIHGVYSGLSIIDFSINPQISQVKKSKNVNPASPQIIEDLKSIAMKIFQANQTNIPSLITLNLTLTIMNQSGEHVLVDTYEQPEIKQKTNKSEQTSIIIGVTVGGIVFLVIVSFIIYFVIKRIRNNMAIKYSQNVNQTNNTIENQSQSFEASQAQLQEDRQEKVNERNEKHQTQEFLVEDNKDRSSIVLFQSFAQN